MKNKNWVELIGYVGGADSIKIAEVAIQATGEVKKVINCSLATTDRYKNDKGEIQERTQWHRLVIWGKKAENLEKWLIAGMPLQVEGRLEYRKYESEGVERWVSEVIVNDFIILPNKELLERKIIDDLKKEQTNEQQKTPAKKGKK